MAGETDYRDNLIVDIQNKWGRQCSMGTIHNTDGIYKITNFSFLLETKGTPFQGISTALYQATAQILPYLKTIREDSLINQNIITRLVVIACKHCIAIYETSQLIDYFNIRDVNWKHPPSGFASAHPHIIEQFKTDQLKPFKFFHDNNKCLDFIDQYLKDEKLYNFYLKVPNIPFGKTWCRFDSLSQKVLIEPGSWMRDKCDPGLKITYGYVIRQRNIIKKSIFDPWVEKIDNEYWKFIQSKIFKTIPQAVMILGGCHHGGYMSLYTNLLTIDKTPIGIIHPELCIENR